MIMISRVKHHSLGDMVQYQDILSDNAIYAQTLTQYIIQKLKKLAISMTENLR